MYIINYIYPSIHPSIHTSIPDTIFIYEELKQPETNRLSVACRGSSTKAGIERNGVIGWSTRGFPIGFPIYFLYMMYEKRC